MYQAVLHFHVDHRYLEDLWSRNFPSLPVNLEVPLVLELHQVLVVQVFQTSQEVQRVQMDQVDLLCQPDLGVLGDQEDHPTQKVLSHRTSPFSQENPSFHSGPVTLFYPVPLFYRATP